MIRIWTRARSYITDEWAKWKNKFKRTLFFSAAKRNENYGVGMCAHAHCGGLNDLFVAMSNDFFFGQSNVFGFMIFFHSYYKYEGMAKSVE